MIASKPEQPKPAEAGPPIHGNTISLASLDPTNEPKKWRANCSELEPLLLRSPSDLSSTQLERLRVLYSVVKKYNQPPNKQWKRYLKDLVLRAVVSLCRAELWQAQTLASQASKSAESLAQSMEAWKLLTTEQHRSHSELLTALANWAKKLLDPIPTQLPYHASAQSCLKTFAWFIKVTSFFLDAVPWTQLTSYPKTLQDVMEFAVINSFRFANRLISLFPAFEQRNEIKAASDMHNIAQRLLSRHLQHCSNPTDRDRVLKIHQIASFSRDFNQLLCYSAPPDFVPPSCMLCRINLIADAPTSPTSHIMSRFLLEMQNIPSYHADSHTIRGPDGLKWKMCCFDCESTFCRFGEDLCSVWFKPLMTNPRSLTPVRFVGCPDVLYATSPSSSSTAEHPATTLQISPIFHTIVGIAIRSLFYNGPIVEPAVGFQDFEDRMRLERDSYFDFLEELRRFHLRFLNDHLALDFKALVGGRALECDGILPVPFVYMTTSPMVMKGDVVKAPPQHLLERLQYHYPTPRSAPIPYVYIDIFGLHFFVISSGQRDRGAAILGLSPAHLASLRVWPSGTQLLLTSQVPNPENLNLLHRSIVDSQQSGLASHASVRSLASKSMYEADVNKLPELPPSTFVPWQRTINTAPSYVTISTKQPTLHEYLWRYQADEDSYCDIRLEDEMFTRQSDGVFELRLKLFKNDTPCPTGVQRFEEAMVLEIFYANGVENILFYRVDRSSKELSAMGRADSSHLNFFEVWKLPLFQNFNVPKLARRRSLESVVNEMFPERVWTAMRSDDVRLSHIAAEALFRSDPGSLPPSILSNMSNYEAFSRDIAKPSASKNASTPAASSSSSESQKAPVASSSSGSSPSASSYAVTPTASAQSDPQTASSSSNPPRSNNKRGNKQSKKGK
jgi:hypothetical protein